MIEESTAIAVKPTTITGVWVHALLVVGVPVSSPRVKSSMPSADAITLMSSPAST